MGNSEFQNDVKDYCLCGAPIHYNDDEGTPQCPGCICCKEEYNPPPRRPIPGFIRMWGSADAVFKKGIKIAQ